MLALATSTITIQRAPTVADTDPYDTPPAPVTITTGVRAVISTESASTTRQGSSQERLTWRLDSDPTDLRVDDQIVDEQTGTRYVVEWARLRSALGLDHVEASLTQVSQRNPALA